MCGVLVATRALRSLRRHPVPAVAHAAVRKDVEEAHAQSKRAVLMRIKRANVMRYAAVSIG